MLGDAEQKTACVNEELLCRGLGKELDHSSASRDLPAGAKADLPLWLASTLAKQGLVQLK